MKHYNQGTVWGRVAKVKEEKSESKGTPYLSIEIECPNDLFGNIKTFGRLWGQEKIDAFLDYHKQHPGSAYRFQGFFSQYDKDEDRRYSNYTFFSWQPSEGKEFRATFVLTGEVTSSHKIIDGDGKICIHLVREGQGNYPAIEEEFEVYALDPHHIDGLEDGAIVQVKGALRYKEAEDYFGGSASGPLRPYVMEIKVFESKEVF